MNSETGSATGSSAPVAFAFTSTAISLAAFEASAYAFIIYVGDLVEVNPSKPKDT